MPQTGTYSTSLQRSQSRRQFLSLTSLHLLLVLFIPILYISPCHSRDPCVGKLKKYKEFAVSSDVPGCSEIGKDVLGRRNGSAADAAIATLNCMGIVNVHSLGPGGGAFFNIYQRQEEKFYTLDAREVPPIAVTRVNDFFKGRPNDKVFGAKSIGVPGHIAGLWELHQRYGKLPWADLFAPSIKLAREGFKIQKGLMIAFDLERKMIENHKPYKGIFADPKTGKMKGYGDEVRMLNYAKTLEDIAKYGSDYFYNGTLADKIVKEIQNNGGVMTKQDLAGYRVKWRTPLVVSMTARGQKLSVGTIPPPSSGTTIPFILNTLNKYDMDMRDLVQNPVEMWHRFMEVSKFAYGAKAEMADEDYKNNTEILDKLTSPLWMEYVRSSILPNATHPHDFYGKFWAKPSRGTGHVSIIDREGNAISATSTIDWYFGSKLMGNQTGIAYNNIMSEYETGSAMVEGSLDPSPDNSLEAGRRTQTASSPLIVTDPATGDVRYVIGASGGMRLISAIAQVMWRSLFFDQDLKQATDAPRIYEYWSKVVYEDEIIEGHQFPKKVIKTLREMGHDVKPIGWLPRGIVQSLEKKDGLIYAYADVRKEGCPAGV